MTFCQHLALFILFDIWARLCWPFGAKLLAILSKPHSNFGASVWRETNLSIKKSFSYLLELGEENSLTRDNLGSALLTWLPFLFLEHNFDTFFQKCQIFSSNLIFENEFLPCSARNVLAQLSKICFTCTDKVPWKIGCALKNVSDFS